MPFVQRVVQPVQLSRVLLHDEQGRPRVKDGELEAVTNHTLSSALRQLASVVLLADEIFQDLGKILGDVTERSKRLRVRIAAVDERVSHFDPKAVTVPESDLTIFSSRKEHFEGKQCVDKALFTADSRPVALRRLYEAAAPTPLPVVRQLDRYRRDGLRSSRFFAVTPVMAGKRRARPTKANDIDIETRTPAVVSRLRMWTSLEALGDVTVDPDCTHKIDATADNDDVDHRLPSPEEQVQAIALKFPAEIVKVDVSGRSFSRMSAFRRSLMHVECDETRRRGNKSRRGRSKRRNTIAGTDTKELAAIVCDSSDTNFGKSTPESVPSGATISEKKSHLESLKEWGRSRLRLIKNSEPAVRLRERSLSSRRKWGGDGEPQPHSSSGNWSASSESGHSTATSTSHHPRSSISSGSVCQKHGGGRRNVMVSTSSSVTSESTLTPDDGETCSMYSCDTEGYYTSFHLDSGLKTLREEEGPMPALRSTSALSAHNSSTLTADSEYELFGKGSTSTTAGSAGTVCTTLIIPPPSVPERVNSHLSTERNVKSLTNLTSDKTPTLNKESAYYRTDNKSNTDPCRGRSVSELKKVEPVKSNLTKENVSKLKEQYSDNVVQADKNCMIMVEVHHEGEDDKNEKCGDSPDSGHNTCSSPVDSVTSPSLDLEMSECSDLEGVDRVERIRVKTTINSSRIPSMCVITPPQSDDEVSLSAMKPAVDIGDYVTIADVRNPATANPPVQTPVPNSPVLTRDTEYVSLNELPTNDSLERKRRQGARVTLDSEGKVVYSSDSLRRRKAIHTTGTFDPGPNIATSSSPVMQHRVMNIRPVVTSNSPILRGDRRLASASLTPTTQKIISASQQIISRPLSPLVGNKKIIVTESTTSTLLSKTDTLEKVDNKTVLPNNQTGLVTLAAQRRTSPSNQKQYFPKSAYGNMSPVATSNRPMSPLVLANNPKITNISNGRRSQTPPTSPVKSPTLSSKPLSPKNVVKANLNRAVSPTSPRGAYVRVKDATGSDEDSKMVKRSDSYRMANDDTKTVFNPNVLGRKQYGAGIVAGPKLLTAIQTVQTNKESKTREEGSSREGASSPPRHWQDTWPQRTPQAEVRSSTPTKPNTPPMNITSTLSPIRSATPTRSPMDLYAIIHESKKKIMKLKGKQSPEPVDPPATSKQVNWPKCIPTGQLKSMVVMDQSQDQVKIPFNGQYQRLSASPTPSPLYVDRQGSVVTSHTLPRRLNSSPPTKPESRYSPTDRSHLSPPQPMPNLPNRNYASLDRKFSPKANFRQPIPNSSRLGLSHSTSRNDFKQLLLRTGWSGTSPGKPSAVERLKNTKPAVPSPKNSKPAVPAVPTPKRKTWKSDVLSSTIPEDCDEADGASQREVNAILQSAARNRATAAAADIPKSSALVSQQCKAFQARSSPTLETAL